MGRSSVHSMVGFVWEPVNPRALPYLFFFFFFFYYIASISLRRTNDIGGVNQ